MPYVLDDSELNVSVIDLMGDKRRSQNAPVSSPKRRILKTTPLASVKTTKRRPRLASVKSAKE